MRRLVVGILLGGALLALCASIALGAGVTPFTGSWTSIDVDGSFQRIQISGSDTPHIRYYDYGCSACGTDDEGNPLYACLGLGEASMEADYLNGTMSVLCLAGPPWLWNDAYPVELTYNAADDTLTSSGAWPVVWTRAGGQ
jgi:hypothetical protein